MRVMEKFIFTLPNGSDPKIINCHLGCALRTSLDMTDFSRAIKGGIEVQKKRIYRTTIRLS